MYLALIADVIDSKMVQERFDLQKQLEITLQKINGLFADYLASCFTLTLGDEFQALLKVDAPVFQIIDTLRSELTPTQLRFGIGLGEIVTAIDPLQSVGADGPAYWNARAAINFVHQKNDYGSTQIYFSSGKENQDFFVNALIASGEAIRSGWRDSQEEILLNLLKRSVYSESFSQQDLAQSLAINPSALSKRLKSSSIRVYLRGRAAALASIQSTSIVVNPYLILLLICHLLSDYYFQSQKMADRKDQDKKVLGLHILYVALPLIVVSFCHLDLWWICFVILLTHAAIDFLKPIVQKQLKLPTAWTFALDQVLHIGILTCLVLMGAKNGTTYLPLDTLNLIFYVLLVGKPSNIAFKILFAKYQPTSKKKMDTITGAGSMIGFLERLVIGACLVYGQFASIGLVFTAKSIARYNKISENPAFAEYYLIGSLFSILSALLAAWLCL